LESARQHRPGSRNYVKGTRHTLFHPITPPTTLLSASASKNGNPGGALHRQPDLAAARRDWALKKGWKEDRCHQSGLHLRPRAMRRIRTGLHRGGGKIVGEFWHPLNTSDYSPYLGQLSGLGIDAVYAMETGADARV